MKKLVIGIDLGTTYSCASVLTDAGTVEVAPNQGEGDRKTPSVLLIEPKKKNIVGEGSKSTIAGLANKTDMEERKKQIDEGFYLHPRNIKAVVEIAKRHIGTDKIYNVGEEEYNPTFVSGAVLKRLNKIPKIVMVKKLIVL